MDPYEIEFSKDRNGDAPEFKEKYFFIDVRELWERNQSFLPIGLRIPLGDLTYQEAVLPKDKIIVTVCEHGVRSLKAVHILRKMGLSAFSLKGGLTAYDAFEKAKAR